MKRMLNSATLVMGSALFLGSASGVMASPTLRPYAQGQDGAVYVPAPDKNRVYRIEPDGTVLTVAGPTVLRHPTGVAVSTSGTLYIGDDSGVYKLSPGASELVMIEQTADPVPSNGVRYIKITSPAPASQWTLGQRVKIRWAHNLGTRAVFQVELSRDGGESFEILADAVHGKSFVWTMNLQETQAARLRVIEVPDSSADQRTAPVSDTMDDAFAMLSPGE